MRSAAFLARKVLLVSVCALALWSCEFPHYEFQPKVEKLDASDGSVGGNRGSGGGGTAGTPSEGGMPEASECGSDDDCVHSAGGPTCDLVSGTCGHCNAAEPGTCNVGMFCDRGKCEIGCATNEDCVVRLSDAPGGDADEAGADGDNGEVSPSRQLTCDPSVKLCAGCVTAADCPLGTLCKMDNKCINGCNLQRGCPGGLLCCSFSCVEPLNGACPPVNCPPGTFECDGIAANGCESMHAETENCGGCKQVCTAPPHQSVSCVDGACKPGECDDGYKDCDMSSGNGCEMNVMTDVNHCGSCDIRCVNPHGRRACDNSKCVPTCDVGWGACSPDHPEAGCTFNLLTDPLNCGACGHACKGGACVAGQCIDCPDTKPTGSCDNSVQCGPYWGTPPNACYCWCNNRQYNCRIAMPDGNACPI
jgi:hypothetical protein